MMVIAKGLDVELISLLDFPEIFFKLCVLTPLNSIIILVTPSGIQGKDPGFKF